MTSPSQEVVRFHVKHLYKQRKRRVRVATAGRFGVVSLVSVGLLVIGAGQ